MADFPVLSMESDLVAYYKLDENSGERANSVTGGPALRSRHDIPNRRVVADFVAASNEYLSITDNADVSFGDEDFSISGWFRPDGSTGNIGWVAKWQLSGGAGNEEYALFQSTLGLRWTVRGGGSVATTPNSITLVPGRWYFVVCWHDATANEIGIDINNGEQNLTAAHTTGCDDGAKDLRLGGYSNHTGGHDGGMANVALYSKVLSSTDIATLYHGGIGMSYSDVNTDVGSVVAFWALDEKSGNRSDSHGSNTLTDNNTVLHDYAKYSGIDYEVNAHRIVADFEASNSESLSIADNAALSYGDEDYTISVWINPESFGGNAGVVGKYAPTTNRAYLLYLTTSGTLQWFVSGDGSSESFVTSSAISTGTWSHVVAYHDSVANEIGLIVNDGTPVTTAHSAGTYDNAIDFTLGCYHNTTPAKAFFYDGLMANAAIFGKVLTDHEITALYEDGTNMTYAKANTLIGDIDAWWTLDEESGTRADSSGSGHTLTDNNTTLAVLAEANTMDPVGAQNKARVVADFEASNSEYLTMSDHADISFADVDFSVSVWVKYETVAQSAFVAKWGSAGSAAALEYSLQYLTGSSAMVFRVSNGVALSTVADTNVGIPTAGVWYHVVAWHDSVNDRLGIVVNAGTPDFAAHTTGCHDGSAGLSIGRNGDFAGDYFDGLIANVAIFDDVLTATEITDLYEGGIDMEYEGGMDQFADLVTFWRLDERSGNRSDSHTGGHTLTDTNSVLSARTDLALVNQSASFNGNSYLVVDSDYAQPFEFTDEDFSISLWVKMKNSTSAAAEDLLAKWESGGGASTQSYLLFRQSDEEFYWYVSDGTGSTNVSTAIYADTNWHHITVYHDSVNNEIGIWVDGALEATAAHTTGVNRTPQDLVIGAASDVAFHSEAYIDEVAFFNKVLEPGEVWHLWNRGRGLAHPLEYDITNGLVEYFPLDESSGARDGLWRGHTLTDNNTVGSGTGNVNSTAADFEAGNSEYLSRADINSFDYTGTWSFAVWINLESEPSFMNVFSRGDGTNPGLAYFLFYKQSADRLIFTVYNTTPTGFNAQADTFGAVTTATWYFVTGYYDADLDEVGISINGGAFDTTAVTGTFQSGAGPLAVGRNEHSDAEYWDGLIEELIFVRRRLTSDEITALYNSGSGRSLQPLMKRNLRKDLVAAWKLNEASGTRYDALPEGLDLTDNNTVLTGTGKIEEAGDFERTNTEYLSHIDAGLLKREGDYSIVAWTNHESLSVNQVIASKDGSSANREFLLEVQSSNVIHFFVFNGSTTLLGTVTHPTTLSTSTWYLVVAVVDDLNSIAEVYLNAGTADIVDISANIGAGAHQFEIGNRSASSQAFDGLIDEVVLIDRALTPGEITELYRGGNGFGHPYIHQRSARGVGRGVMAGL